YIETSLLNARTFESLAHLNEVTAWWLAAVADVRRVRDFQETPAMRHAREQPQLLPLPACDYDTALVLYRHVNVEGFITHRLNHYSVPWSYIGQVLPVRVSELLCEAGGRWALCMMGYLWRKAVGICYSSNNVLTFGRW